MPLGQQLSAYLANKSHNDSPIKFHIILGKLKIHSSVDIWNVQNDDVITLKMSNKALFQAWNWAKRNKILYCKALRCETMEKMLFSFMSNLLTWYHFEIDF